MRSKLPGGVGGWVRQNRVFSKKSRKNDVFSPGGILGSPYLRIGVETKNLLFSVFRGLPSVESPKIWAPNSTPGPSYDSSKNQKIFFFAFTKKVLLENGHFGPGWVLRTIFLETGGELKNFLWVPFRGLILV